MDLVDKLVTVEDVGLVGEVDDAHFLECAEHSVVVVRLRFGSVIVLDGQRIRVPE